MIKQCQKIDLQEPKRNRNHKLCQFNKDQYCINKQGVSKCVPVDAYGRQIPYALIRRLKERTIATYFAAQSVRPAATPPPTGCL